MAKISKCHKPDFLQCTFSENIGVYALENPYIEKSDLWQIFWDQIMLYMKKLHSSHLKADVFEWAEPEVSRYHQFLVATKKEIQKKLEAWVRSGLEANNKILRSIRLKLSRKTSQADNLDDVINRLWLGSDPKINRIRLQTQPYCKHCIEYGHSTLYC